MAKKTWTYGEKNPTNWHEAAQVLKSLSKPKRPKKETPDGKKST